jgi:hypothetical protein
MAAEVSLGWNNDKLLAGSKQAEAIVQRTASQMQSTLGKASGGGAFRSLGQVSLQVQDIAVQLQAGAKASTVLAQQGTQILSAFGAGGAIAGGVLAIGTAFYGMREAAVQAFREAKKESDNFDSALSRLLINASPTELSSKYDQLRTSADAAAKTLSGEVSSIGEVIGRVTAALTSEASLLEQNEQLIRTSADALRGMASIEARLIQLGQQNLDITSLRANGKAAEADELQRQIELAAKLFQIQQSQFSAETKAALTNQAISASTAAARAASTAQAFAETQKLIDAQNKLEDIKRTAALESASIYDREKLLKQEITAEEEKQAILRADFVPDQLAIVSSEERLLRLKQDLQRTQTRIADEAWRAAEAQDAARIAAQEEANSRININGPAPAAAAPGEGSTKARESASQSRGLSGFFEQQNQSSQFDRLQQGPSQFEQSQQGMSAFQRLQFQAAQDRAAGPVMPMPAPAANTQPAASDPRPIVQAIQTLPEEIARRLLGQ